LSYIENNKYGYQYDPSTKDYLIALSYFPNYTKLINPVGKTYQKVHSWLLVNEERLKNDDIPLPTITGISNTLKLSSSVVKKSLVNLYEDIFLLNENSPKLFILEGQTLCNLSFTYFGQHTGFSLGFNRIPRVNENISFDFIKPKLGTYMFHVNSVDYCITNNGNEINIYLSDGWSNSYLKLLKEKAYLHKQISSMEYFTSDIDSDLEQKLLRMNKSL
jgi:hypothetical protein